MTLQQLEYIRAVDEYRHFGKAANACGVTQPTLSLMIKKLEEELDVTIFDRDAHPLCPTAAGRVIIDKAAVVLYNAGQLVEMTKSEKLLSSGVLNIAMTSTISPSLTPPLFNYIGSNFPDIQLVVKEIMSDTILEELKKAEIDMGIMVMKKSDPDLLEIPLYHERFLAYVSPDDELYEKEEIQAGELLDRPIWIMKDGLRRFDKSMLAPGESFSYDKMYQGGRAGTLIYMVNENGGMTIVPELHTPLILYSMQKNLRRIVNPEVKRTVSLVIRRDYIHESILNIVIDAVKSAVSEEYLEDVIRVRHLSL